MKVTAKYRMRSVFHTLVLLVTGALVATGQSWNSLGGGVDGPVHCFAVFKNELYAGGTFGFAGVVPAANIARWNGESWAPVGSGTNGTVRALFVQGDQLYVGGDFTVCGDKACTHVARWDGTAWNPAGTGLNGPVYAMAEYQRVMYIGGAFTKIGPSTANQIAAWNGTGWQDVTGGLNDTVFALAVTPFNDLFADLYAGGAFASPGPLRIAWLHPAYQAWRVPEWGGFNAPVFAVTYYTGGIVAGGAFTSNSSGSAVNHLAWKGNQFYGGVDGEVHALLSNGSDLYVGGSFHSVGRAPGIPSPGIAKWNGGNWESLGSGANGRVRAIALYQNGLCIGGDFDSADGRRANHLACWGGTVGIEGESRAGQVAVTNVENYPNPFNATTIIEYTVGGTEEARGGDAGTGDLGLGAREVALVVYDVLGREVVTLVHEWKPPGIYQVTFNRSGLASGLYFCRLTVGKNIRVRSMVLIR